MEPVMGKNRCVFTIGHSNHTLERFTDLLKEHGIEVLVDVRSHPYSRFAPHFNAGPIRQALAGQGIRYVYLGKELGGRPDGRDFYDEEGKVIYSRIMGSNLFSLGIDRLLGGINNFRASIMCSEEDPVVCHRRLLIGSSLAGHEVSVYHIRGDGRVQADQDIGSREEKDNYGWQQLSLF